MSFAIHTTISKDGTIIGYRQTGNGPKLVICHGGGRISQHYEALALALADNYTVIIPDRRGRGLSGAEGLHYNLKTATEDLQAVLQQTQAQYVFGHSAGAMIALETMQNYPVQKLALYEPPVSVNHSFPIGWLQPFEKAVQAKKYQKAMAISLKGLNIVDGIDVLPLWVIQLLLAGMSLFQKRPLPEMKLQRLIPTLAADIKMITELQPKNYKQLNLPIALMHGEKSPKYFKTGLNALLLALPNAQLHPFEGLSHYSPENKINPIATYLKQFFTNK